MICMVIVIPFINYTSEVYFYSVTKILQYFTAEYLQRKRVASMSYRVAPCRDLVANGRKYPTQEAVANVLPLCGTIRALMISWV
ncbi:hypothetical protein SDC9_110727 [bioreactor metagenome]|uniref:Uncharacterized protein n=1 Tax=bioreactor metagenome TaxID=1076179 RepID=A0A645BKT0_9ZZZZ